jgi:hypothetical protein
MYYYLALTSIANGKRIAIRHLDEQSCRGSLGFIQQSSTLAANYNDTLVIPGNTYVEKDYHRTDLSWDEFKKSEPVFADSTAWVNAPTVIIV